MIEPGQSTAVVQRSGAIGTAALGPGTDAATRVALSHLHAWLTSVPQDVPVLRGLPGATDPAGSGEGGSSAVTPPDWVSDGELRIAAGASPAGADDRTIYRVYGRYAQAIEDLSAHLEPSLRKIATAAFEAIDGMQDIFARNNFRHLFPDASLGRHVLAELHQNGKILIPAFSKTHALLMDVEVCDEGYRIRIYNSGEGLEKNHALSSVDRKWGTCVEYTVDGLSESELSRLMDMGTTDAHNHSKAQDVYDWVGSLRGSRKTVIPEAMMTWQTRQKTSDCVLEVVNAYLRDTVARAMRADPVLSARVSRLAKPLYLEMKAAYLSSVKEDYTRQRGVDASTAGILHSLSARIDRAEISAGFSGPRQRHSGISDVHQLKGYLRLCNQLAGLIAIDRRQGSVWYADKRIPVTLDEGLTNQDVVVYREDKPRGVVFTVNRSTGGVTIDDHILGKFQMRLLPVFDQAHGLERLEMQRFTANVFFDRISYFQLDASEVPNNPELVKYFSPEELQQIAQLKGTAYISVDHSDTGYFSAEGYVFDPAKSSVVKFQTRAGQSALHVFSPTPSDRLVFPTAYEAGGAPRGGALEQALSRLIADRDGGALGADYRGVISSSRHALREEIRALTDLRHRASLAAAPQTGSSPVIQTEADGSVTQIVWREVADGGFEVLRTHAPKEGGTFNYLRQTLDREGNLTQEAGVAQGRLPDGGDALIQARTGELSKVLGASTWSQRRIEHVGANDYRVIDQRVSPDKGRTTTTTQTGLLGPRSVHVGPNAMAAEDVSLGSDQGRFALSSRADSVEVVKMVTQRESAEGQREEVTETRYIQEQLDGSRRTLVKTESADGRIEWRSQDLSLDGKQLGEVAHVAGSASRSERKATILPDGSLQETLIEEADPAQAPHPDQAVVRTERLTSFQSDGTHRLVQTVRSADCLANVGPGGHPYRTEQRDTISMLEKSPAGQLLRREKSHAEILEDGKLTTCDGELVWVQAGAGEAIQSMASEVTLPNKLTLRSETEGGQVTEKVRVGERFVLLDEAAGTPELRAAAAAQELARSASMASLADQYGLAAVAPLLVSQEVAVSEVSSRQGWLADRLTEASTQAMARFRGSGAIGGGAGALSLYGGVTGLFGLRDAIRDGNVLGICQAVSGLSAGGAELAELGLGAARLVGSSTVLMQAPGRALSLAGRLSLGLGAVALGLGVPSLVEAIQRGDAKAIVSSSVGLGGGVAATLIGAAVGGAWGMGVGLLLGGAVIGFVELWNKLFNPGTGVSGANPLMAMTSAQRLQALKSTQVLFNSRDQLDGSLSKDRLHELSRSGPSDEIKAAAQYFVDNEALINWMDAANGGVADLDKRNAKYDGEISKSDVARFIGYLAMPPEIYRTLPAPSQDARLWALGIIDPDTQDRVIDAFGKDGEGQGSGDGTGGLAEYANIASGLFDDHTWWLLKEQHPEDTDAQTTQRRDRLTKACAYLAAYPSEYRAVESFKNPGQEDGELGMEDLESMRASCQGRIDALLAQYPEGLPSFNESAEANRALGDNNPALWRPGRFGEPNPERPQSYYQVILQNFASIDADNNGELNWTEMANARERALQGKQYGLYFALDDVMRNGADLFPDRGEGMDLQLRRADLALRAGRDQPSAEAASLLLPISSDNRACEAATLLDFVSRQCQGSDRMTVDDLFRLAAGYWQGSESQEVTVPDAVRQAALYFVQQPTELGAICEVEQGPNGPVSWVRWADLKALAGNATPRSSTASNHPTSAREDGFGWAGITPQQEANAHAFIELHFDEIDVSEQPSISADGKVSQGDVKRFQQQALDRKDWKAYEAMGWLLINWGLFADTDNLLLKGQGWTPRPPPDPSQPAGDDEIGIDL